MTLQNEPGIGHNGSEHGFDEDTALALRTLYDELLGPPSEEVSTRGMKPHERLISQRNATMMSLIRMTRRDHRMDCAPAILAVIAALSDNDYGRATISNPRLARLLKRDLTSVERRMKAMLEAGYLRRTVEPGKAASTGLVISRVHADLKPNEIINIVSPMDRNGKTPPAYGEGWVANAPAPDAGGSTSTTRTGRGGYGVNGPASGARGASETPRTQASDPPRQADRPPAPTFRKHLEIAREFLHITATSNTANKKNTAVGTQARAAISSDDLSGQDDLAYEQHRQLEQKCSRQILDFLASWGEVFKPTKFRTSADVSVGNSDQDEVHALSRAEVLYLARCLVVGLPDAILGGEMPEPNSEKMLGRAMPRHMRLANEVSVSLPHCTIADVREALMHAENELRFAQWNLEHIRQLLEPLPGNGIIASSEILQRSAAANAASKTAHDPAAPWDTDPESGSPHFPL